MMKTLNDHVQEYKVQLQKGDIKLAYRGLMRFMMDLRIHFMNKYPEYKTAGSIYPGYMDMTYFALFPESIKKNRLKIAVVFQHEDIAFEVWLSGVNKQVQSGYMKLIREKRWTKYRMPASPKGADSIIEYTLSDQPDFNNPEALTIQIEKGVVGFIKDVEDFLGHHQATTG